MAQSLQEVIRYRLLFSVPETAKDLVGEFRRGRLDGQDAQGADGGLQLSKVGTVMAAHAEMKLRANALQEREAPL